MVDSQTFTKAIDLIKFQKKLNVREIAEQLGVERHIIDNIKRGTTPSEELWDKLIEEFPIINTRNINYTNPPPPTDENTVMDEHNLYYPFSTNAALSELVETQKKLIFKLETENALLGGRIAKLEAENAALRDVLTGRGKI